MPNINTAEGYAGPQRCSPAPRRPSTITWTSWCGAKAAAKVEVDWGSGVGTVDVAARSDDAVLRQRRAHQHQFGLVHAAVVAVGNYRVARRRSGLLGCPTMSFSVQKSSQPRTAQERADILAAPGFGKYFTDHMVRIDWTADGGWSDGAVLPYGPLALDPATMVLHYGQEIFEGLKAYQQPDGSIATFRAEANAARFQRSARRLAMAELPTELFVESVEALVDIDRDWVPSGGETSLYLRPFMVATEVGPRACARPTPTPTC